jgi:non-ribosomal peptide synthetase component F
VFTFQNIDIGKNNSHHLEGTNAFNVTPYEYRRKTSVFNLHLIAVEVDGRINMSLEYSTHLFKKSTVENMSEHFLEILNQVLENPGINLKEVKMTYDLMAMESKNIDDQMDFAF